MCRRVRLPPRKSPVAGRETTIPQLELDFDDLANLVRQLRGEERRRLRDLLDGLERGASANVDSSSEAELAQLMDPSWAGLEEDWASDDLVAAAAEVEAPPPRTDAGPSHPAPTAHPGDEGGAAPDLDEMVDAFRGEAPAVPVPRSGPEPRTGAAAAKIPPRPSVEDDDLFSPARFGLDFGPSSSRLRAEPEDPPPGGSGDPVAEVPSAAQDAELGLTPDLSAPPEGVGDPPGTAADFDPFAELESGVAAEASAPSPSPEAAPEPPSPVSAPPASTGELDPFADLLGDAPLPTADAVPEAAPPDPLSVPGPAPEDARSAGPGTGSSALGVSGDEHSADPLADLLGTATGASEDVEEPPPPVVLPPAEPESEPPAPPPAPVRRPTHPPGDDLLGALARSPARPRPRVDDEENVRTSIYVPTREAGARPPVVEDEPEPEPEPVPQAPPEPEPMPEPEPEPVPEDSPEPGGAATGPDPLVDLFSEPEPAGPATETTWEKRFRALFAEVRSQAAPSSGEALLQELRKALQEVRGP